MSEQWNPAENDAPEGEVRRGRGEGRGFGPCGRGHHLHGRHFHGPHSDGPHSDELHLDGPHSGGRHSDGLRAATADRRGTGAFAAASPLARSSAPPWRAT
jgi:hypothetical protein